MIMGCVRKLIAVDNEEFIPKVMQDADTLAKNLESSDLSSESVNNAIRYFAVRNMLHYMTDEDFSDEFLTDINAFSTTLRNMSYAAYLMPGWLFFRLFGRSVLAAKAKLMPTLLHIIHEQFDQPHSHLKILFDYRTKDGELLSDNDIAHVLLISLFTAESNLSAAIRNTLQFLSSSPEWEDKFRQEADTLYDNKELSYSPTIHACVLEAMRCSAHMYTIVRLPSGNRKLGKYVIPRDSSIAYSGWLAMCSKYSEDKFTTPYRFNPERYLICPALKATKTSLSWGSGVHACPARNATQHQIKYAVASILRKFNVVIPSADGVHMNYANVSALAHSPFKGHLERRDK